MTDTIKHGRKLLTRLRDWRRGYSDADVKSVSEKMRFDFRPGQWVEVPGKEFKALRASDRDSGARYGVPQKV